MGVHYLMKDENQEGFQKVINDQKEKIYESEKVKPLGKTLNRNYDYPQKTKNDNFYFGVATKKGLLKR